MRIRACVILFILISYCYFPVVYGLNEFIHFSSENGLSNNSITCIIQDRQKFMWIGTNDGLNKFDGTNLKVYRNIISDSTSIPGNDISSLFIDSEGKLWIGTYRGGACFYDPDKDSFIRLGNKRTDNGKNLSNSYVTGIAEDKNGYLWITTYGGLNRYDRKTEHIEQYNSIFPLNLVSLFIRNNKSIFPDDFEQFVHSLFYKTGMVDKCFLRDTCITKYSIEKSVVITESLTDNLYKSLTKTCLDNQITSIYCDDDGIMWLGYLYSGFSRFDPKTYSFIHYPFIKSLKQQPASDVTTFLKHKNKLYIGYEWGVIEILDLSTKEIKKIINHNDIYHLRQIVPFDENHLWVVSGFRLMIFDINTKSFTDFTDYFNYKNAPVQNSLNYIYTDSLKNKWLGSKVTGLYLIYEPKGFEVINSSNFLTADWIGSICQDRNQNFWVGYYTTNLDRLAPGWKNRRTYSNKSGARGSFASESVNCIFQDSDGKIWISNYQSGLQLYNPTSDNFITYKHDPLNPNSLPANDIRWITEDKKGCLWLATHGGGLCKFDKKNNTFTNYITDYNSWQNNLPNDWLTDVVIDNSGQVWIGTLDGFSIFDTIKGTFRSFRTSNSILPHDYINDIFIDSYQNIWIGTQGGLSFFDRYKQQIYSFTKENGLPNNDIKAIIQDNNDKIWISSSLGLFNFQVYLKGKLNLNLLKQTIHKFDISDGISSNEFCVKSCFKTIDGMILFGGRNGITAFYPDSIKQNLIQPPVFFTNLKVFNNPIQINHKYGNRIILSKSIYLTDSVVFDYKQNVLTFEFVALNYIQPNKNQYKYRLTGFDDKWQDIGNKHEVTYTNLRPGSYHLDVIASNNDGIWNNTGRSLTIIIKPPYWSTLWFKFLVMIILVTTIISLYYFRLSQVKKMNLLLQDLVDKRTQEINEKNRILIEQKEKLNKINILLDERRKVIEEQSMELMTQRDELSQLNITKDKLFSILAHDLKGPFNAILGFSELLVKNINKYPKEKIETQVLTIRDVSRFTYELLENLLQWSRAQRGIIEFEPQSIKMSELLEKNLKVLRQQALRKKITINVTTKGEERSVKIDPNMLSTVIRNLTSNAIKYSYKGSEININLDFSDGILLFSITDHGVGISDELKEKIFDLNEFITKPGTSGEKGTGLGLFLCSDFIARHNGKIWVESKPNQGSTFFFSIPSQN